MKKLFILLGLIVATSATCAVDTNWFSNAFWFDEYGAPLEKTNLDFWLHYNWDRNVVVNGSAPDDIEGALTWAQDYEWLPAPYAGVKSWLTSEGSVIPCLEPVEVTSGGIGVDGADGWLSGDNGQIIFAIPE